MSDFPAMPIQVLCCLPGLRVEYVPGAYPVLLVSTPESVRTWGVVYASTLLPQFGAWIRSGEREKILALLPEVAL